MALFSPTVVTPEALLPLNNALVTNTAWSNTANANDKNFTSATDPQHIFLGSQPSYGAPVAPAPIDFTNWEAGAFPTTQRAVLGISWRLQASGNSADRSGSLSWQTKNIFGGDLPWPTVYTPLVTDDGRSSAFGPATGNIDITGVSKIPVPFGGTSIPGHAAGIIIAVVLNPMTQFGFVETFATIYEVWIELLAGPPRMFATLTW